MHVGHLNPKVLLSPRGTKWILGRLLQSQFLSTLSEIFGEDRKTHELSKNIIFISISTQEQKLWHKKPFL